MIVDLFQLKQDLVLAEHEAELLGMSKAHRDRITACIALIPVLEAVREQRAR